jgi:hypothetical protein
VLKFPIFVSIQTTSLLPCVTFQAMLIFLKKLYFVFDWASHVLNIKLRDLKWMRKKYFHYLNFNDQSKVKNTADLQ